MSKINKRKNRSRRTNQHLTKKKKKKQMYIGGDENLIEIMNKLQSDISSVTQEEMKMISIPPRGNPLYGNQTIMTKILDSISASNIKDIADYGQLIGHYKEYRDIIEYMENGEMSPSKDFVSCIDHVFSDSREGENRRSINFKGKVREVDDDRMGPDWIDLWNKALNHLISNKEKIWKWDQIPDNWDKIPDNWDEMH